MRAIWSLFAPRQRWLLLGLFILIIISAALEVIGLGLLLPFVQITLAEDTSQGLTGLAGTIQGVVGEPPGRSC